MLTHIVLYSLLIFYIIILIHHLKMLSEPIIWHDLFVLHNQDLECDLNDPNCPTDYHCYPNPDTGVCIKLQDNLTQCNESTGILTLTQNSQGYILKCVCKYPHLVTQLYDGTNCDIDVACKPHGKLASMTIDPQMHGECECKFPYVNLKTEKGPSCIFSKEKHAPPCYPGTLNEQTNKCECPQDYYIGTDSDKAKLIFKKEYLNQFLGSPPRCIPWPCSYNVFNNKHLVHGNVIAIDGEAQCFCDPRYGNFGVYLETQNYLNNSFGDKQHHNACANIYETEPNIPVDHTAFCFYYYKNFDPQCYLKFKNVNSKAVNEHFTNQQNTNDTIHIKDEWPNNFFNQVFRLYENKISAVIHYCEFSSGITFHCHEGVYISKYDIINCKKLENMDFITYYETFVEYNTIFMYPACKWTRDDTSPEYKNHVILNPLHMLKPNTLNLYRTNGVEVYPDKNNSEQYTVKKYSMSKEDYQTAYERQGKVPDITLKERPKSRMHGRTLYDDGKDLF